MKVILNIDTLTQPMAGIGNYTLHLAQGLKQHPEITDLRYFSRFDTNTSVQLIPPKRRLPTPLIGLLRKIPFLQELRRKVAEFSFRTATSGDSEYLYHSPNFILYPYPGASIVTVPDLSHIRYPEYHPKDRVAALERSLHKSLKQATRVIAISEFVRKELIDVMGVAPEKVIAVPLGVDAHYQPRNIEELNPVLRRYDLEDQRYLLSVCTLEPRKNLTGLVEGYSRLTQDLRRQHPLVVVGASGWLTGAIEKALAPLERDGQLRRLGYVDAADLPMLYAGAYAFAYPSFYEGFGLPPLEAMASGVPALVSDRSSLPEVVGDAALMVNPDDVENIAGGLERLLTDEVFRERATKAGLAQAGRFSWANCVERTVDVYKQAIA